MSGSQSTITFGCEAEFLLLDADEQIVNLTAMGTLREIDIVGADGHQETIELRPRPASSAFELFENLSRAIAKYVMVLERTKMLRRPGWKYMRAGAFYRTPLSMHIHFRGLPSTIPLDDVVRALQTIVGVKFLDVAADSGECSLRRHAGYGPGNLTNSVRVKAHGGWEWREPFSCLTPQHAAVLLYLCELIVRVMGSSDAETFLRDAAASSVPQIVKHWGSIVKHGLGRYQSSTAMSEMCQELLNVGAIDWHQDLLPLWLAQSTEV